MKYLLAGLAFVPSLVLAEPVAITFDDLATAASYDVAGYHFAGNLTRDSNFATPSLRVYGNVPLTVTRTDGGVFSLEAIEVLYRSNGDSPWLLSNNRGQALALTREGVFDPAQLPSSIFADVTSLTLFDPTWRGTTYYILDNLQFAGATAAPINAVTEPAAPALVLVALGLLAAIGRKHQA